MDAVMDINVFGTWIFCVASLRVKSKCVLCCTEKQNALSSETPPEAEGSVAFVTDKLE